ncbi:MAG: peptidoglycan DD-metalloendopeptidase family protein [Clostridia bacterium]|nr:peptidoglycan DD-metalloendopeptidase family protein [Clostridia bacterium]
MNTMKRMLSLLMTFSVIFVSVAFFAPRTQAKTISSLKEEQSQIQAKIDESEKKLTSLNNQINSQEQVISELNKQLSNLSDEYNNVKMQKYVVDGEIAETQKKIEDLNAEIAKKDAEIEQTIQLFCKRLRANYMAGSSSTLEMLSNASSVSVFLNRLELLKRVTNNDQALVDELNKEINDLEKAKSDLEAEKLKLVQKQAELGKVEADLQSTLNAIKVKSEEVDRKLSQLQNTASEIHENIKDFDAQEAQIQKEINRIYAQQKAAEAAKRRAQQQQQANKNNNNSGASYYTPKPNPSTGFAFPVHYSGCYLSSGFGYRSASISGNAFHGGIDITGGNIYGQPVIASRSGTVIVAEHYSNSGYGHYVMLDHGDGYQTLYGHCSSVVVNKGDYVKQGQVIAYVGSTGNSTGPHLHFEVRYQGEKLNPLNYVSF